MIHTVKGFGIVNETEVDVFLEFPSFPYDPVNVGNLISGSSFFSKPGLDMWKFFFHIMQKPSMQNFKHDLTSIGDECNCLMDSTLFSTTLLGNWDEDWSFPVLYKRTHTLLRWKYDYITYLLIILQSSKCPDLRSKLLCIVHQCNLASPFLPCLISNHFASCSN